MAAPKISASEVRAAFQRTTGDETPQGWRTTAAELVEVVTELTQGWTRQFDADAVAFFDNVPGETRTAGVFAERVVQWARSPVAGTSPAFPDANEVFHSDVFMSRACTRDEAFELKHLIELDGRVDAADVAALEGATVRRGTRAAIEVLGDLARQHGLTPKLNEVSAEEVRNFLEGARAASSELGEKISANEARSLAETLTRDPQSFEKTFSDEAIEVVGSAFDSATRLGRKNLATVIGWDRFQDQVGEPGTLYDYEWASPGEGISLTLFQGKEIDREMAKDLRAMILRDGIVDETEASEVLLYALILDPTPSQAALEELGDLWHPPFPSST
jgi:hypothetical protein